MSQMQNDMSNPLIARGEVRDSDYTNMVSPQFVQGQDVDDEDYESDSD